MIVMASWTVLAPILLVMCADVAHSKAFFPTEVPEAQSAPMQTPGAGIPGRQGRISFPLDGASAAHSPPSSTLFPGSNTASKDSGYGSEGLLPSVASVLRSELSGILKQSPSLFGSPHLAAALPNKEGGAGRNGAPEQLSRLLSGLIPSLTGMQVGLDVRLPFFNIPFATLISRLAESNGALRTENGGLLNLSSNNVALLASVLIMAAMFYPQLLTLAGIPVATRYRGNDVTTPEDVLDNMQSILQQFNVDGESCMKVALCSVGQARLATHQTRTGDTTRPIDVIDSLLSLTSMKQALTRKGLQESQEFGAAGGDCSAYNKDKKCPVDADSWQQLLSDMNSIL